MSALEQEQNRTKAAKKAMLEALYKNLGIVSKAAEVAGIGRGSHYRWMEEDEEYKREVESVPDYVLDFVEDKLHSLIKDQDTTATIFYLKTKGKKRGYIERSELDMSGQVGVNINQIVDDGCEPLP
jgi:hypothetical protein